MNNINNIDDTTSITFQKMIFVYNALSQGWTVKMLEKDRYEFTKEIKNEEPLKKEVCLADYLRKFIQYNINIENTNF